MTQAACAPYFSLDDDCILVSGAVNAAVYQLSSGEVYAVDRAGRAVLEGLERGLPHARACPGANPTETLAFLRQVAALGIGRFSPLPERRPKRALPAAPFALRKIWLELTTRCNLRCLHCYADASPAPSPAGLSLEAWLAVIDEAAALGANWIQFIGGEPLLAGRRALAALLWQARRAGIAVIEVFTNGTLLDEETIDLFAQTGARVALSVYASTPLVHDQITQVPGSFARMVANARELRRKGVPIRFGFVAMRHNQHCEQETLAWARETFGDSAVTCDVVRCTAGGRSQSAALLTPALWRRCLRSEPVFPPFTAEGLARARSGSPCLLGQLCVQADGRVYPCIMDRDHALGSVTASSLASIVEGAAAREVWGLSKDRLPVCRDCEFRYACMDCRPLALGMASALGAVAALDGAGQDLYIKDPGCLYDPYAGTWGSAEEFMEKLAAKGLLLPDP